MNSTKGLWIAVIVVALIAVSSLVFRPAATKGVTNYDTLSATGLQIGSACGSGFSTCNGTAISQIVSGTCYLWMATTTTGSVLTASTTTSIDCQATNPYGSNTATKAALSNVPAYQAGDRVFITMSTSTPIGVELVGAIGSTTAGYIQVQLNNQTGGNVTIGTTTASGIQFLLVR